MMSQFQEQENENYATLSQFIPKKPRLWKIEVYRLCMPYRVNQ